MPEFQRLEKRVGLHSALFWKPILQANEFWRATPAKPARSAKVRLGPFRASTRLAGNPNLVDLGRYRLALESGLRLPLVGRFSWNIRFFDRFDSRPPSKVKRNDYGIISGFGVSF